MSEKIRIIARTDIEKLRITIKRKEGFGNNKVSSVVDSIRTHLIKRHASFSVTLFPNEANRYGVSINELPSKLIALACTIKKPFVCNDYDYLQRSVRSIACKVLSSFVVVQLSYDVEYLTTYRQEEIIDDYLSRLFFERKAYSFKQPEKKIKFAYDYIVSTVKYDNEYKMHSAYNALIDKRAVCEGCSLLFYRFMAKLGIPCRIITGKGMRESHAWNMVRIGSSWYNIDVTWDLYKNRIQRSLGLYNYFLVGDNHFFDHTRDAYFESEDFKKQFPVSQTNYQ